MEIIGLIISIAIIYWLARTIGHAIGEGIAAGQKPPPPPKPAEPPKPWYVRLWHWLWLVKF